MTLLNTYDFVFKMVNFERFVCEQINISVAKSEMTFRSTNFLPAKNIQNVLMEAFYRVIFQNKSSQPKQCEVSALALDGI